MADAAARRREARKLRILQNSENRLKFISGAETEPNLSSRDNIVQSLNDSELEQEEKISQIYDLFAQNGTINPVNNILGTKYDDDNEPDYDVLESTQAAKTKQASKLEFYLRKKVDIIILALIIQLFYHFSNVQSFNIAIPLIIVSLTKVFMYPTLNQLNLLQSVLLLSGITSRSVHTIMNVTRCIKCVMEDLFIYMFVIILMQSIIVCFLT